MVKNRFLSFITVTLCLSMGHQAESADSMFRVDVISPENDPRWNDSWLFDINNQGQATGYVRSAATNDYLPVIYGGGTVQTLPVLNGTNPQAPDLAFYQPVEMWHNFGFEISDSGVVLGAFHETPSNNPETAFTANGPVPIALSAGFLKGTGPERFPFSVPVPVLLLNGRGVATTDIKNSQPAPRIIADAQQRILTSAWPFEQLALYDGANAGDVAFVNSVLAPTPDEVLIFVNNLHGVSENGRFVLSADRVDLEAGRVVNYLVDLHQKTTHVLQVPENLNVTVRGIDSQGTPFGVTFSGDANNGNLESLLTWNPDGSIRDTISLPPGATHTFARNVHGHLVASTTTGPMFYDGQSWSDIAFVGNGQSLSDSATVYQLNDRDQFIGLTFEGNVGYAYFATMVPEPTTWLLSFGLMLGVCDRIRRRSS